MTPEERDEVYLHAADIDYLLLRDVHFGIDYHFKISPPIRHLPEADRRVYERTRRAAWAGRRRLGGRRIV